MLIGGGYHLSGDAHQFTRNNANVITLELEKILVRSTVKFQTMYLSKSGFFARGCC